MAAATKHIGPYQIIGRPLGTGGMATVYKVKDPKGRIAALKVLHEHLNRERKVVERFKQEFNIGQKMSGHDNFVAMMNLEKFETSWTILMEFVPGETLEKQLLEADQATAVVANLAFALHAFHKKGLVHRDLKPENIILSDKGRIKIMDYGVTRELNNSMTRTGTTVGTPLFMAPEQLKAEKGVDHRADIYSLGVIFYRLLCKRDPHGLAQKAEYFAVATARLHKDIKPIPGMDKENELFPIIQRCMACNADQRPQTTQALVAQLKELKCAPRNIDATLKKIAKASSVPKSTAKSSPKASPKKMANNTILDTKNTNAKASNKGKLIFAVLALFITSAIIFYFLGPKDMRNEISNLFN